MSSTTTTIAIRHTMILTSEILDADKTAYWHQCVMIEMQEWDLILLLSQYEEHSVKQFGDFAHIVQPYGSGHLEKNEEQTIKIEMRRHLISGFFCPHTKNKRCSWSLCDQFENQNSNESEKKRPQQQQQHTFQSWFEFVRLSIMNKIIILRVNSVIHVRCAFFFF